jgi:hypothetical protein
MTSLIPVTATTSNKTATPKHRYIIGESNCYFEPATYLGDVPVAKVISLFNNKSMELKESQGKSLKVMFKTDNEIKFVGFVTAGDASIELSDEDVSVVMQHAQSGNILKAIGADELVAMF